MAETNPQQVEAQAAFNRLLSTYRQVFGTDGNRTEAQQIVWNDMRARARVESPVFIPDASGHLDPLKAAWADGARGFFLQISEYVRSRVEETNEVKVKK